MPSLGLNVDHIANIREARKTFEPDPVRLAFLAEIGGADGITVHLREDRRHIQERDLRLLKETISTPLNMEMAATREMIEIAKKIMPSMVTLVPEKREEITTEGGLNVKLQEDSLKECVSDLQKNNITVSLFVDPIKEQLEASYKTGTNFIELHTGTYAESKDKNQEIELAKIIESTSYAINLGMKVNAGHGLTYNNVEAIASIEGIEELNIGHSIIARSIAVGLKEAVKEMKALIRHPRSWNM
tara:strand:- start:89 stop:820 length:732 start_codon:yes stop_codon:yes gene_type:complete